MALPAKFRKRGRPAHEPLMPAVATSGPASDAAVRWRCRICRGANLAAFLDIDHKRYQRCARCMGTLTNIADLPTAEIENAQYRFHCNDVEDSGYRAFVGKLVTPLIERARPGAHGLDYGCGPGPVGAVMLREQGFVVDEYDPLFASDPSALSRHYDFVFCCEVVEHFHDPAREFDRLEALLKPGGWLAVMTCFQDDDAAFASWHYRRDPTHVAFYRADTMRRIADDRGWRIDIPTKNVALFQTGAPSR
jgi:SAM-dependent methyltransferase